jgi:hypothetical protein
MTEKQSTTETKRDKISAEVAEMEFDKFVDAMDIDVDPVGMNDEDRAGFNNAKRTFLRAVRCGSLIVNDNGEPVFTPQRAKSKSDGPITFYEPTGATLMQVDQAKKDADVSKTFKVLGEMTKTTPKTFSNLALPDVNVCSAVLGLFMG